MLRRRGRGRWKWAVCAARGEVVMSARSAVVREPDTRPMASSDVSWACWRPAYPGDGPSLCSWSRRDRDEGSSSRSSRASAGFDWATAVSDSRASGRSPRVESLTTGSTLTLMLREAAPSPSTFGTSTRYRRGRLGHRLIGGLGQRRLECEPGEFESGSPFFECRSVISARIEFEFTSSTGRRPSGRRRAP